LTKRAIPHLRRSDDPCIVNITSIAGVRPVGSSMAYSMSKAALNQMTLLLAKSFGPIRVNAVAPGLVRTPWTEDWDAQHAAIAPDQRHQREAIADRELGRWRKDGDGPGLAGESCLTRRRSSEAGRGAPAGEG
jgi:ketoreductase RED2